MIGVVILISAIAVSVFFGAEHGWGGYSRTEEREVSE